MVHTRCSRYTSRCRTSRRGPAGILGHPGRRGRRAAVRLGWQPVAATQSHHEYRLSLVIHHDTMKNARPHIGVAGHSSINKQT